MSTRRKRAGVIPYFFDKKYYFILGCDQTRFFNNAQLRKIPFLGRFRTCDLADFGGGVETGETYEQAALRELKEETEDVLSFPHLREATPFHKGRWRLYFQELKPYSLQSYEQDLDDFMHRISKKHFNTEMLSWVALTEEEFMDALFYPRRSQWTLWPKIVDVIYQNETKFKRFIRALLES